MTARNAPIDIDQRMMKRAAHLSRKLLSDRVPELLRQVKQDDPNMQVTYSLQRCIDKGWLEILAEGQNGERFRVTDAGWAEVGGAPIWCGVLA